MPSQDPREYFAGARQGQTNALLCRPMPWGSTVLEFDPDRVDGGEARYCCRVRLSYSEHVQQCELLVMRDGATMPWRIGYLERTETHLRVKARKFVNVEVWKLNACGLLHEDPERKKKNLRALPTKQRQLKFAMTTKAEIHPDEPLSIIGERAAKTEEWTQVLRADDKDYRLIVASTSKGQLAQQSHLDMLLIKRKGRKVCVARKQYFQAAGEHEVVQPFLGVRFYGSGPDPGSPSSPAGDSIEHLLSSDDVLHLLICLAWSSETTAEGPQVCKSHIQAMRIKPGQVGSASEKGFCPDWDMYDVKKRLTHVDFVQFDGNPHDSEDDADLCMDEGTDATFQQTMLGSHTLQARTQMQRTDTHVFRAAVTGGGR